MRFWCLLLCFEAPGPLPFAGALVDPLVTSLHFGGSCWFLFWLLTGDACGGPPVCVVGAVGAGPSGILSAEPEGWPWALLSLLNVGLLRMVFSLLPSSDDDHCCGCVAILSALGGTNFPWTFLVMIDSSGLYEAFPWGLWWASLRSAASLFVCGALLSLGVGCQNSAFYTTVCSVCGFSMSNVIRFILFKLNPMSFSSKDLSWEKEPDLFMWGCLLSPCIITCISLLIELTSSFSVYMIWSAFYCSRSLLLGR